MYYFSGIRPLRRLLLLMFYQGKLRRLLLLMFYQEKLQSGPYWARGQLQQQDRHLSETQRALATWAPY
jgi:hypothetical protein